MLYKICGSCGNKIKHDEICPCRKKRGRGYDRENRNKVNAKFYNSREWKKLTRLCKLRANGLDLYELEINKRIVKGSLTHHIEELEDNRGRALDINNLIWVGDRTHAFIHAEYEKSSEAKEKMQEILFKIIKKYTHGGDKKSFG
ncbi:endonuclease [Fusobacterium varium]